MRVFLIAEIVLNGIIATNDSLGVYIHKQFKKMNI